MRILIFDTETTGLLKANMKVMTRDTLPLSPHIVQFSYLIYDTNMNAIVESVDNIIRVPDEICIPEESSKIHGITNEISREKGEMIQYVLKQFVRILPTVDLLVAHNLSFDLDMIRVELTRMIETFKDENKEDLSNQIRQDFAYLNQYSNLYCTLQESIELCDLKSISKFGKIFVKFPKLSELHKKLFYIEPQNLHNSYHDILITLRCFMKMRFDIDLNASSPEFHTIVSELGLV